MLVNLDFPVAYRLWVYLQSAFLLVVLVAGSPLFVLPMATAALWIALWSVVMMAVLFGMGLRAFPGTVGSLLVHLLTGVRTAAAVVVLLLLFSLQPPEQGFVGGVYQLATPQGWRLFAFLALAETTDFFDGRLARRLARRLGHQREQQTFGGIWDMENDALYALALSVGAWQLAGVPAVVLIIGMMRYLYFLAVRVVGDPPDHGPRYKQFAKTTTATLMIVLVGVYIPVFPGAVRTVLVAAALTMQLTSFGWDLALNIRAGRIHG